MKEILKQVEQEIQKRNIPQDKIAEILSQVPQIKNRRIISGYASVSVVDREGHRITIPALKDAAKRFMSNPYYVPLTIYHSDCMIGRILPKWTNPETGETIVSEVDDVGFKIVGEIRDDIEIADKVWDEVERNNIRSFSIAGNSKDKIETYEGGKHTDITALDLYEIALCELGVNPMSKFDVLMSPNKVEI